MAHQLASCNRQKFQIQIIQLKIIEYVKKLYNDAEIVHHEIFIRLQYFNTP